ncbi:GNAT family N-acetyltransferase [Cypionkella sp. TWP1-2-1b2]|uniref:GNAT family N-acetyltransferase n=1 Tax=Cypionkella sp. TWP1-2-1b2 TaxID=2804675 RepID=UPI003CEC20AA
MKTDYHQSSVPLRPHLKTARLTLRPVAASDQAAVVTHLNDLAISGWLARVPVPYTAADFDEFATQIAYPGETFTIEDASGFAGIIGAGFELGYWLAPRAHGQGYATEAARAVLDMQFAYDESTVAAGYFEGNAPSARVLAKLGFVETGRRPKHCRALGQDRPHVDLLLTPEAFLAANPLEIITPRLRLAPLDIERDWRDIARIGGDPQVAPMTNSHLSPWPEADVRATLAESQWRGRLGFRLGIWFESKLIGAIGIWDDPVETGYFLDPAFWGRGIATEAMAAFLPPMIARFGLAEVFADHCTDNPASGAVLRKLGFRQIGEGIGESLVRGAVPILIYRLDPPKVNNVLK